MPKQTNNSHRHTQSTVPIYTLTDSRRIRKQNSSNHRYNGKHDPYMVVVVVGLLVSIVYYLTDTQSQAQSHTVDRANIHTHRHTDSRRIRKQNNSNHRYNGKHDPCMVVVVGLLV